MNKNYQSGNLIIKQTEGEGALILGDCNSALDKKIQKLYKIQTIISIGQEAMPPKQKLPQNCFHKFYDIHDNKSQKVPPQLFDQISDHIQTGRKKGGVLVHCYAGVSRSSTFVIAYIMRKRFYDYDKSKQLVKKHRSCIHPGDEFVHQLKHYWKVLQKREEQRLKQLQRLNQKEQPQKQQIQLSPSKRRGLRGAVKIADVPPEKVKQIQNKLQKNQHPQKQQIEVKQVKAQNEQLFKIKNDENIQLVTAEKQIKPENSQKKQKIEKSKSLLKKQKSDKKIQLRQVIKAKPPSVSQLQKQKIKDPKIQSKNTQIKKVVITNKNIITKKVQQSSSQSKIANEKTKTTSNQIISSKQLQDHNKLQDKYQKTKNIYTTKTKVL